LPAKLSFVQRSHLIVEPYNQWLFYRKRPAIFHKRAL